MATQQKTVLFSADEVKALAKATLAKSAADRQAQAAQEKREGSYAVSTKLAAKYGADFEGAMSALFTSIRTGEVKGFGAKANDKGDGFVIPSGLMSAKSVLSTAIKHGVDLFEETDEGQVVRPFSKIRADVSAIKAAQKLADRNAETVRRDAAIEALRELADHLATIEADGAMADWADGVVEVCAELTADVNELMAVDAEADDNAEAEAAAIEAALAENAEQREVA